jgi:DNA ligase-3
VKRCKNGMYVEIKYDGERVQIHKNGDELAFYSRNLKPVKEDKVDQVRESLPQAVEAETIILDGEILLMDTVKHVPLPFGTIGKNKKKKFTNAAICFFAFDILYLNGESLIDTPLDKRKKILAENVKVIRDRIEIGEYVEATKAEEVDKEMLRVMADGLEGLVIKDTKGIYKPNMRHWLKLKKVLQITFYVCVILTLNRTTWKVVPWLIQSIS